MHMFLRNNKNRASHLFWILPAIHWIAFFCAVFYRGELATPIHLYYEAVLLKMILIFDLPAILTFENVVSPISPSLMQNSFASLIGLFVTISLQWIFVGLALDKAVSLFRRNGAIQ